MRLVEEDRRLLMQASGGCFRFVEDVERLSTIEGRRKNRQRRKGLQRRWTEGVGIQVRIQTQYTLYGSKGENIYSGNVFKIHIRNVVKTETKKKNKRLVNR